MTSDRPNKGWVRFLTILVSILTVLAILSTWVDRQIFDSQEWGDTSLEMLQDPAIQDQVASFAVDELYDNVDVEAELEDILPGDLNSLSGVAAGALRSVADQGAKQALNNQRVQNLWERANVAANEALVGIIEDDGEILQTTGGQVTLELQPLIVEIADQVGLGQQARDNIPASVGQIEIVDSEQLSSVQTASHPDSRYGADLGFAGTRPDRTCDLSLPRVSLDDPALGGRRTGSGGALRAGRQIGPRRDPGPGAGHA